MRAVLVKELTTPDALRVSEVPLPEPGAGEVRVRVRAAGCNFADTLVVQGRYQHKPTLPFVPGVELAGEVDAAGPGAAFAEGERVLAAVQTGAYAEYACVAAAALHRIPPSMSFEHAAAMPVAYPTSHAALVLRAGLAPGETLLVHAAAGGVGLAAVQIGRALGARVLATVGGAEKAAVAREAGADVVIDYRAEDFVECVRRETDGRGADVIYDSVGGDTTDRSLKCIAWNGRLIVIGFASGTIPAIKTNRILLKNIAVTGLHWPAYAIHEPQRVTETLDALFALYESGGIQPLVSATHPLEALPEALRALAARETHGKIVILP